MVQRARTLRERSLTASDSDVSHTPECMSWPLLLLLLRCGARRAAPTVLSGVLASGAIGRRGRGFASCAIRLCSMEREIHHVSLARVRPAHQSARLRPAQRCSHERSFSAVVHWCTAITSLMLLLPRSAHLPGTGRGGADPCRRRPRPQRVLLARALLDLLLRAPCALCNSVSTLQSAGPSQGDGAAVLAPRWATQAAPPHSPRAAATTVLPLQWPLVQASTLLIFGEQAWAR